MRGEREAGPLRRYVLGASPDDECDAIEREYFDRADALDRMSEAEDDLIDDYLSGRLRRDERGRFERYYLSTPYHRRRVAVVRAVRNAASAAGRPTERRWPVTGWSTMAGLAAALVILVAGAAWMIASRSESGRPPAESRDIPRGPSRPPAPAAQSAGPGEQAQPVQHPAAPAPPAAAPVIVAVWLSPILVRGAAEPAVIAIAPGVDIVRLQLEGQAGEPRLGHGRAVVRVVGGREVWRGSAEEGRRAPDELARVDIPAVLLRPELPCRIA